MAHHVAQECNCATGLLVSNHVSIDAFDGLNEQFLDNWIFERTLKLGHRFFVAIRPFKPGIGGRFTRISGEPLNNRKFNVAGFAHEFRILSRLMLLTRTLPVSKSCISERLSACRACNADTWSRT